MQPASAAGQPGAAVAQVRFPLPSGEELVIAEAVGARAEAADSRDRTGRGVWAGSWALATLLHRPGPAAAAPQARDKVVVELGSGCALAGLAAAAAGAREAWLTDHCEAALVTAAHNAAVNSGLLAGCSVRTAVLDWDAPCVAEEGGPPQCDLVLGADVLYSVLVSRVPQHAHGSYLGFSGDVRGPRPLCLVCGLSQLRERRQRGPRRRGPSPPGPCSQRGLDRGRAPPQPGASRRFHPSLPGRRAARRRPRPPALRRRDWSLRAGG
eukprot:TRINITY_DN30887_c0_g1_i3.p1 TRINITY_DN30887_c0_g1~~TRINITY_DN30887_c0_g1_i3.p1  ORF type:complete len:290 (+),score=34.44 TRINITY_DN30887_c0_g1_i3:72-872(+)